MGKPIARIKSTSKSGSIYVTEFFVSKYSVVLHKHCLTSDVELATYYGIVRKFWNKYYTEQEICFSKEEFRELCKMNQII